MNPTKSILSLVATALLLGAIYVIFKTKEMKAESSEQNTAVTSVQQKLFEQAKNHPGLKEARLTDEEKISECKPVLESIETLPLKTLVYDLKASTLKLDSKCLFHGKNDITALKDFPEVCAVLADGEPTKECVEKLFFYKALRIHHATYDDDLDTLPTEVIIQKLMAVLSERQISPEGLKQMKKIGTKIYERLPESESAARAAVLGNLISAQQTDEEKARLDQILSETRAQFPANWDLYEMNLIHQKNKNQNEFKKAVQDYYNTHPTSPIAQYYMGCLQWSESNSGPAKEFFKFATTSAPTDTRFKNTYEASLTRTPPDKVCTVQINFDPENF